jgi:hypothetical protein
MGRMLVGLGALLVVIGLAVIVAGEDWVAAWAIAWGHFLSREEYVVLFSGGNVDFIECGVVGGGVAGAALAEVSGGFAIDTGLRGAARFLSSCARLPRRGSAPTWDRECCDLCSLAERRRCK